eukprot:13149199-Heterocapsa_arctica.AAC.1
MFKDIVDLDQSIFDTIGPRGPGEHGNYHQLELDDYGNAVHPRRPLADAWTGYRPQPHDQAQPALDHSGNASHRS